MKKIEKEAALHLTRSMSKKALKKHNNAKRGDIMPRPVVFVDKRLKRINNRKYNDEY